MQRNSRRRFLRHLTFSWGSVSLAGCGGGQSSQAANGTTPSAVPNGSAVDAPLPAASAVAAPVPPPVAQAPSAPPLAVATNPQWIVAHPANAWFAIPGTRLAGSAAAPTDNPLDPYASSNRRLAYSGMAMRNNEIVLAACGGHNDYSGNEVNSIDLSHDSPTWTLRSAASAVAVPNVAYYPDGAPAARHTYWSTIWSPQRNRVMLHYSRFVYGSGTSFRSSNGFNLDGNSWDPKGTWADGYSAGCDDPSGNCYAMGVDYFTLKKWTPATDTWATVATFSAAINVNPVCFDSTRGHLFALAWGDGQGNAIGGGAIGISAFKIADTTKTNITFNPSAALTQFQADAPAYSGMDYDPINDQYLFYECAEGRTTRIYVVKPNSSAVWDMRMLALDTDSVVPVPAVGAGVFNRFRYVGALRGFVLMSSGTSELYFIRTS